jgi:hypothetical protein
VRKAGGACERGTRAGAERAAQTRTARDTGARAVAAHRRHGWRVQALARVEQQRDAGQGRAWFGHVRMELRRGDSGQTRTEGSEAVHGGSLVRAAVEGPAMWQGWGDRGSGNRRRRLQGQRRAERRRAGRRRAAHGGVPAEQAQDTTG